MEQVFKLLFGILTLAALYATSPLLNKPGQTRIVGGAETTISRRPYQISMRYKSVLSPKNFYKHSCGGSIYDKNFIITAAHCSANIQASELMIVAGSSYSSGTSGVISPVREIIYHQDFDPDTFRNDIAVLVLSTPLPINNFTIRPIEFADREYPAGTNAVVSGWGSLRYGGSVKYKLSEVTLPLVSFDDCSNAYQVIGDNLTKGTLCAGVYPAGGKDACQGDSGGPLAVDGKLVGVVSSGEGCGFPHFPGLYTDINYISNWILEKIANAKKRYNLS